MSLSNHCSDSFRVLICTLLLWVVGQAIAQAQLPSFGNGPDAAFAQMDFAQMYLDQQNRSHGKSAEQRAARQKLVDSGVVSALDLAAPNKAVDQYNVAASLLKVQKSKEAIPHLQKAIAVYPKFVSAHNTLGLAYLDQDDARAKTEFETAAQLDDKFAGSFLNLGYLALSGKDFSTAEINLKKAASLSPKDVKVLTALAFAQNGNHNYQQSLATAQRVHELEHRGEANIHYLAASAALALNDTSAAQEQLKMFVDEDPTNPMAPTARQNLDILAHRSVALASSAEPRTIPGSGSNTFPNSDRLKAQLASLQDDNPEPDSAGVPTSEKLEVRSSSAFMPDPEPTSWVIHKTVEETELFFSVSSHGHMISDLDLANIQLRDNDRPPDKVVRFLPQSKLPLRLGLLIDTSGSVQGRFGFEQHAAENFLHQVLNGTSDLGFVAGFNSEVTVSQDFSADPKKLSQGVEALTNSGGTALFDAVWLGCWKLAAYPEKQAVARVLVVLTDGEDNSSHRSLKQVLHDAESANVTIYAVSTKEVFAPKTDADRILDALAEHSGGESMFPRDLQGLNKALEKLRELIRSRYFLAYKPMDFAPNGQYHAIKIMAERGGKRFEVHSRRGYYARAEAEQK